METHVSTFMSVNGVLQNAPAPRFSRTSLDVPRPANRAGADTEAILRETGFSNAQMQRLRSAGALS
jgi:alpha-methylacyl-CoA racemase